MSEAKRVESAVGEAKRVEQLTGEAKGSVRGTSQEARGVLRSVDRGSKGAERGAGREVRGARCGAGHKVKSLASTLFSSMLAFTLAAVLVLAGALTTVFYATYEHQAETQLVSRAHDAAEALNATPSSANVQALSEQFGDQVRYTLIAPDGTVLFDSQAEAGDMGNHADRPEVQTAEQAGEAFSARYSETAGTDTLYVAIKLDDGSVVRASEVRVSLAAFLGQMMLPVTAALAVAAVLVFALSRLLTRRIMKPVDALNFAEPLENDIYEEMVPLLVRIDEQQRQLKEQNKELALAESMRRDFSSNVSHEMKTPLQVISGYAELMKSDMVPPDDCRRFSGLIYDEAQTLRSLINDVLTLSRLDESALGVDVVPVDLLSTAERAAGRLESFAASYGVTVRVQGETACIAGSETLVEEMVYNLIENGIRYNREGGFVQVSVEACEGVVVRVRDSGPGIPAGMEEKIFERFFRLDKSRSKETGGTGLGLAIVKHAVIYHKGSIAVNSAEGQGTEFVLTFPKA